MKQSIIFFLCIILANTSLFAAQEKEEKQAKRLLLTYLPASNAANEIVRQNLIQSDELKDMVNLINEEFVFLYTVNILLGSEDGPLYDHKTHQIQIPYAFLSEITRAFSEAQYQETGLTAEQAADDALFYILFHELGHALIDMYDLPILGKQEDAADNLATIMLIEYLDGGAEVAISAADLFDIEADIDDAQRYWDEHSLDTQRAQQTLCYVYGSDPQRYESIAKDNDFRADFQQSCINDYQQLAYDWEKLLRPHFRQ